MGHAGCDQRGCRTSDCHPDKTRQGEATVYISCRYKGNTDSCLRLHQEANYALTPGQPLPADAKTSLASLAQTATSTATSSQSTSSSTTTAAATESSSSGNKGGTVLSTGAIVGIAVGGAALLALAGGLFWYVKSNVSRVL
jgi:hypothetical protein